MAATAADLFKPLYAGRLVDAVSGERAAGLNAALWALGAMVAPGAGTVLFRHLAFTGLTEMTLRTMGDTARKAFARLQRFSTDRHANNFAGSTVRKIMRGMWALGERGVRLSGGERQRVALARALLADAPILILDEATSSLDSESEALIQQAVERLMEGRTTVVFAHRLSTVRAMDRILVFDRGKLVEEGAHAVLLDREGGRLPGAVREAGQRARQGSGGVKVLPFSPCGRRWRREALTDEGSH